MPKTASSYRKSGLSETIQKLVRRGRFAAARKLIHGETTRSRRLERADRLKLAYVVRQSSMPDLAIELLHPIVRPHSQGGRARSEPTAEELAEYGLALAEFGLGAQAIEVLEGLDVRRLPRIFYGLVLAYFRQWDWEKTVPIIERWLGRREATPHELLWGRYYLGRALLHGPQKLDGARDIFKRLALDARSKEYLLLQRETLLALADAHYLMRDWRAALARLHELEGLQAGAPEDALTMATRQLYAQTKLWTAAGPARKRALSQLREVRARFVETKRWERVRLCDYQEALALADSELLLRLYHGTPYPVARSRFKSAYQAIAGELPDTFDWPIANRSGGRGARLTLDLLSGATNREDAALKPGQTALCVVQAIAGDLYVPPRSTDLHARLHPSEHFNPLTSPARVRQALCHARDRLRESGIPLIIDETDGRYSFSAAAPCALRFSASPAASGDSKLVGYLRRARARLEGRSFQSQELAKLLGLSERSTRRLLTDGLEQRLLDRIGSGPATRYRFKSR